MKTITLDIGSSQSMKTWLYDITFGLTDDGYYYLEVLACIPENGQRTTPEVLQQDYAASPTASHEVFIDLFKFAGLKAALAILESIKSEFDYFLEL